MPAPTLQYAGLEYPVLRLPTVALAVAVIALAAVPGCASRTLPLPPPEVSQVSGPGGGGRVTVTGFALEGASVGIVNDRTLQGTIVTSPSTGCDQVCPFQATLEASAGDSLRVWQFFETEGAHEALVPQP